MIQAHEALNGLWQSHAEITRQYGRLALDGMEQLFRTQVRYLGDICRLHGEKQARLVAGLPSPSLEHWRQYLESHLDSAAEMTHSHLDITTCFHNGLTRLVQDQLPALGQQGHIPLPPMFSRQA